MGLGCPAITDVATISASYSQLTGVLAGFAFTALVVLLTPTQVDERRAMGANGDRPVLASLFAAFVALVVAALNYSVLAGESMDEAEARAYTGELINGIPFGLAAIMLFHGISQLLRVGRLDSYLITMGRILAVVIGPCLTYYYIVNGASDTESLRATLAANVCVQRGPPRLGVILALILFLALLIVLVLSGRRVFRSASLLLWLRRMNAAIPVIVLSVSVAVAAAGGSIAVRDRHFLMSPISLQIFLVVLFAVLLLLGILLAFDMPQTASSPVASGRQAVPASTGEDVELNDASGCADQVDATRPKGDDFHE